jgi:DNA modification methylase
VKLHNADCFEILKTIESDSIDLIVTDPPYGIDYKNTHEVEEHKWDSMTNHEYAELIYSFLEQAYRVLKPEGTCWFSYGMTMIEEVLWAIHETEFEHHYENCVCMARHKGRGSKHKLKSLREEWMHLTKGSSYHWDPVEYMRKVVVPYTVKDQSTGERKKRGWEYGPDGKTPIRWSGLSNVLAFHSEPVWVDSKKGNLGNVLDLTSGLPLRFDGEPSDVCFFAEPSYLDTFQRQAHSAQKPIMLIVMLVALSSKPKDVVLDPFMGAGTTGVACKILGRDFIGIEREDGTFKTAERWINGVDLAKAQKFVESHVRTLSGLKFGATK